MTQVGVSQYCEENRGPEDRTPGVAKANLLLHDTKREAESSRTTHCHTTAGFWLGEEILTVAGERPPGPAWEPPCLVRRPSQCS